MDGPFEQGGNESCKCKTHSRRCRGHHCRSSGNGPHQLTAIQGGGKGPSGVVGADEDEAEEKERREDVRGERGKLRNGEEGRNTGEDKDKCGKVNKKGREERRKR